MQKILILIIIGMILIPPAFGVQDAYTQFKQCDVGFPEVCLSRVIAKLQEQINVLETKTQALKKEIAALARQQSQLENSLRTLKEKMVIFQDHLKNGGFGPQMVWIPAGRFRMGDIQGSSDEKPVHEVSVDRFAMSRYEVTFAEYDKFAQATGRQKPDDRGWGRGNRPVINVSWHDANVYAKWLSEETGQKYRLPTEAEWEYAARAGTLTARDWGKNPDEACGYANVHDITSKKENGFSWTHHNCTDGYAKTAPVGHFKPNNFGLYDMLGNVWEWTCSEYENKYKGSEKFCKEHASSGVIRGGSWNNEPRGVRVTNRDRNSVSYRFDGVGFRLTRP
ncbi:MAG: SUMF1/EgtB/PvdO family nonheme iron enzyme [Pseudomonadota bacterium]